jgi:hypothetical protein
VLQESGALSTALVIDRQLWVGYKIYFWFLISTFAWVAVRVLRIWLRVPPFSRSENRLDPNYQTGLRFLANSIQRWAGLVLICGALLASIGIVRVDAEAQQFPKPTTLIILFGAADVGGLLAAGLVVVLALYLLRWHVLLRLERNGP